MSHQRGWPRRSQADGLAQRLSADARFKGTQVRKGDGKMMPQFFHLPSASEKATSSVKLTSRDT